MAKSVKLDRSTWGSEALARAERHEAEQAAFRDLQAARLAHPFAGALDLVGDESMAATLAGEIRFKSRDFGNGHKEACVWRHVPNPQRSLERAIDADLGARSARGQGDLDANRSRAARRAKQKVRLLCKSMLVNSLWTLTYRVNVTDRDLVLAHLAQFRRRVRAVIGEWKYIAVLERQERGAWHIHLATHALPARLERGGIKVKSWDVMRAIWRSVVGQLGGNFDEAKRRKRFGRGSKPIKGAGAIAAYIAGYVAKDMEESELNRKRYSVTEGIEVPECYRALWPADTPLRELLEVAYASVGDRITRAWFDPVSEVFFIESDDSVPVG